MGAGRGRADAGRRERTNEEVGCGVRARGSLVFSATRRARRAVTVRAVRGAGTRYARDLLHRSRVGHGIMACSRAVAPVRIARQEILLSARGLTVQRCDPVDRSPGDHERCRRCRITRRGSGARNDADPARRRRVRDQGRGIIRRRYASHRRSANRAPGFSASFLPYTCDTPASSASPVRHSPAARRLSHRTSPGPVCRRRTAL